MSASSLSRTFACAVILAFPAFPAFAGTAPADPVAQQLSNEVKHIGVEAFTSPDYKQGTVRHVVLIRFRDGVSNDQRSKTIAQFLALRQQSLRNGKPYIESIETGPQISGEGASHGLQQAFIVTFASQGDRNYFIGTPVVTDPKYYEPAHAAFKQVFKPVLAKQGLLSFDFPVHEQAQ